MHMDNEHKFKDYIYWGVTAFCVIAGSIAFGYFLLRIDQVKKFGLMLLTVLMPVIYGAVMAYLLAPVYNWCVRKADKWLNPWVDREEKRRSIGRFTGTVVSLVVLLLVVAGLSSMLIPQLVSSIQSVLDALPENVNNFIIWVQQVLDNNQDVVEWIVDYTDQALEWGPPIWIKLSGAFPAECSAW